MGHENNTVQSEHLQKAMEILAENEQFIRNTIYSHIRDHHIAEDIYQDFFISIVRQPVPDNLGNIHAFLNRVLRNDAIDASRKNKSLVKKHIKYYETLKAKKNYSEAPENELMVRETDEKVMELAEKHLPASQFEAIKLRYHQGCNVGETAKKMKIDKRSVSRYLSVGLKKLHENLAETHADLYECV